MRRACKKDGARDGASKRWCESEEDSETDVVQDDRNEWRGDASKPQNSTLRSTA